MISTTLSTRRIANFMEKNSWEMSTIKRRTAQGFILGLLLGMAITILIVAGEIKCRDQKIKELEAENAVLKEENQDIMSLWSDLVNGK